MKETLIYSLLRLFIPTNLPCELQTRNLSIKSEQILTNNTNISKINNTTK